MGAADYRRRSASRLGPCPAARSCWHPAPDWPAPLRFARSVDLPAACLRLARSNCPPAERVAPAGRFFLAAAARVPAALPAGRRRGLAISDASRSRRPRVRGLRRAQRREERRAHATAATRLPRLAGLPERPWRGCPAGESTPRFVPRLLTVHWPVAWPLPEFSRRTTVSLGVPPNFASTNAIAWSSASFSRAISLSRSGGRCAWSCASWALRARS
jgi:hypothetical protein